MRSEKTSAWRQLSLAILPTVTAILLLPTAKAQNGNEGLNAVYGSGGVIQASAAFIDAKPYATQGDICAALNYIILHIAGVGAVIDARGFNPGTTQACAFSPWNSAPGSGTFANVTILLPAGTIATEFPWVMPDFTHIVGQGPGQTILQACKAASSACTGAFSGAAMIALGGSSPAALGCGTGGVCFGIQVSDLTLNAQSQAIDGIDNFNSEEETSVHNVTLLNIGGTGLRLSAETFSTCPSSQGTSNNSGPYDDLQIGVTSTANACVQVLNVAGACPQAAHPRGLHGITCQCIANGTACSNTHAGIQLDGGSVSVEDVSVNGFTDGIAIGDQADTLGPIQSLLVSNVKGGSSVTNLVHIYNATAGELSDITVLGATSSANTTILDALSNITLTNSGNPNVGMYVLGEPIGGGNGFTRFTTSTSATVPTWFVGSSAVSGTCSTLSTGTLYSNISGTNGGADTLYACASGTWQNLK